MSLISKDHPTGYLKETEKIKENKKKHADTVHPFTPAQWTHPNGHPRCLLCGGEQPIASDCNREATPEEEQKFREELDREFGRSSDPVEKAYDPHEPRDWHGRWVKLSGKGLFKKIGIWEHTDGTHGVYVDGKEEPLKTFKTKKGAENFASREMKKDENAHWRAVVAPRVKRKHAEQQKARAERQARILADQAKGAASREARPVHSPGTKKPPRRPNPQKFTTDTTARLTLPGQPTLAQRNDATVWARRNMPDNEAKYAGLIARLSGKGITQDPKKRGDMSKKYGIPAGRLIEIEQQVYAHMFPQKTSRERRRNLTGGVSSITEQQKKAMLENGAITARVLAPTGEDTSKIDRLVKATKGPHRGKWVKVSWNGTSSEVSTKEAANAIAEGKAYWTHQLLFQHDQMEKVRAKRKEEQAALLSEHLKNAASQRAYKIKAAQKWASSKGFDHNDSYWWGFFWNDSSLISSNKMQDEIADPTARQLTVNLGPVMQREHMDPKLLEGILALPDDFSSRRMRGHRPGPRRATTGDEDFKPAEKVTTDPEWESKNRDRWIKHDRRQAAREKRAAERRKGISKHDFNPNEPRDYHGRWSKVGGALHAAAGMLDLEDKNAPQHVGTRAKRAGAKVAAKPRRAVDVTNKWDHRRKSISQEMSAALDKEPLPHKGLDRPTGPNGKDIATKKISRDKALYMRNNGDTKITNARLSEIYSDRSKITPQERNLLMSAGARMSVDGGKDEVKVWVVRDRAFKKKSRFFVMNTLRKEIANDLYRNKKGSKKGASGHVVRRDEISTSARKKENAKRVASGRNKVNKAFRDQMMSDWGTGDKAPCIFCGKHVHKDEVSPERMKPGPIGGKYEKGNVAPAHERCNTLMGTEAQHRPEMYYDEMMRRFLRLYNKMTPVQQKKMGFVFAKNRGKLGARPK